MRIRGGGTQPNQLPEKLLSLRLPALPPPSRQATPPSATGKISATGCDDMDVEGARVSCESKDACGSLEGYGIDFTEAVIAQLCNLSELDIANLLSQAEPEQALGIEEIMEDSFFLPPFPSESGHPPPADTNMDGDLSQNLTQNAHSLDSPREFGIRDGLFGTTPRGESINESLPYPAYDNFPLSPEKEQDRAPAGVISTDPTSRLEGGEVPAATGLQAASDGEKDARVSGGSEEVEKGGSDLRGMIPDTLRGSCPTGKGKERATPTLLEETAPGPLQSHDMALGSGTAKAPTEAEQVLEPMDLVENDIGSCTSRSFGQESLFSPMEVVTHTNKGTEGEPSWRTEMEVLCADHGGVGREVSSHEMFSFGGGVTLPATPLGTDIEETFKRRGAAMSCKESHKHAMPVRNTGILSSPMGSHTPMNKGTSSDPVESFASPSWEAQRVPFGGDQGGVGGAINPVQSFFSGGQIALPLTPVSTDIEETLEGKETAQPDKENHGCLVSAGLSRTPSGERPSSEDGPLVNHTPNVQGTAGSCDEVQVEFDAMEDVETEAAEACSETSEAREYKMEKEATEALCKQDLFEDESKGQTAGTPSRASPYPGGSLSPSAAKSPRELTKRRGGGTARGNAILFESGKHSLDPRATRHAVLAVSSGSPPCLPSSVASAPPDRDTSHFVDYLKCYPRLSGLPTLQSARHQTEFAKVVELLLSPKGQRLLENGAMYNYGQALLTSGGGTQR